MPASDDVFMDVPSFDDDDGDDDGVDARKRSVEKVETKRRRGEDRDVSASAGARVKKAWERTGGGDRGDGEGGREDASGSAAGRGKGEKTKKRKEQRRHKAKSEGEATKRRDDADADADGKGGDDGEKKVSGRVLGRRRRAAEKRKRLAAEKRAAKREAAAGDGSEKPDENKQKQKKTKEEEEKKKEVPLEDIESSDYDEELLPEKPVILGNGGASSESESEEEPAPSKAFAATKKSSASSFASSYMEKMRAKLSGGQFRMLNERLYTTTGEEGLALVQDSPELFEAYHAGFRSQVESWPTKPVHVIAKILQKSPKNWIVADFGCGDAELSRIVQQKCHSFDLQTPEDAPEVVACNMSDVPLNDASVDCAVFSLSLMGTDYGSFLEEAHRVLKPGGLLWIAEVRSRFDGKNGAASVSSFISALSKLGFKLKREPDERNTMFFTVELIKTWVNKPTAKTTKGGPTASASVAWPPLKACSYKKR